MPRIPCKRCKKIFYSKPSWIKKGKGKYCSIFCSSQSKRTGQIIKCHICGKKSYKQRKELNKSKSGKFFCGIKCSLKWHNARFIGKKSFNWKHGEYSYKRAIIRSKIPQVCKLCNTSNKNIIIVHHIDKNRKNNKLKNLIWLCRNCHFLVHHYAGENKKLLSNI